jgi:endo-1,4-beta-xylanase
MEARDISVSGRAREAQRPQVKVMGPWGRAVSAVTLLAALGCKGTSGAPGGSAVKSPDSPAAASADGTCDPSADLAPPDVAKMSLAQSYSKAFKVGVAVNNRVFGGQDPSAGALVAAQFNRVTPENELKWESLEKQPGVLDFSQADAFLAFAEQHHLEAHGHTFVWHHQVPAWVFKNSKGEPASRTELLAKLEGHLRALSERYGNRFQYWDVVNEAFEDDGSLRKTQWRTIIGDDYIELAFRLADKYFPKSKLVYNDFSLEKPAKRDAVVKLVKDFKARGVRIDAIGNQAHFLLDSPTVQDIDAALVAFASTGAEVLVSELDVDVLPPAYANQGADLTVSAELSERLNPYPKCLPKEVADRVAQRWADVFQVFSRHAEHLHAVTLWGVSDGYSWLNNWPVRGRSNYALLFDRELHPKLAWQRVIEVASTP